MKPKRPYPDLASDVIQICCEEGVLLLMFQPTEKEILLRWTSGGTAFFTKSEIEEALSLLTLTGILFLFDPEPTTWHFAYQTERRRFSAFLKYWMSSMS